MGADAATALAALAAAGTDREALISAIKAATFLDETPGEDRQKLRGTQGVQVVSVPWLAARATNSLRLCLAAARTKLKNLTRDEAAKKAAAAAKSAADRSPHTKEARLLYNFSC